MRTIRYSNPSKVSDFYHIFHRNKLVYLVQYEVVRERCPGATGGGHKLYGISGFHMRSTFQEMLADVFM